MASSNKRNQPVGVKDFDQSDLEQPKPQTATHLQHQHTQHVPAQAVAGANYTHVQPFHTQPYYPSQNYPYVYSYPPTAPYQWPHNPPTQPPYNTMASTQHQNNVPQIHNKSSPQVPSAYGNDRSHNQIQQVNPSNPARSTPARPRQRTPAILKDPNTKEVLALGVDTKSASKNSSKQPEQITNVTTTTSKQSTAPHPGSSVATATESVTKKSEAVEQATTKVAATGVPSTEACSTETTTTEAVTKKVASPEVAAPEIAKPEAAVEVVTTKANATSKEPIHTFLQKVSELAQDQDREQKQKKDQEQKQKKNEDQKGVKVGEQKEDKNEEEKRDVEQNKDQDEEQKEDQQQDQQDDLQQKQDQEPSSELGLSYEPWQYHPVSNKGGKRVYTMQFLLDVCVKVCKMSPFDKEDKNGTGYDAAFSERIDFLKPAYITKSNDTLRRQHPHNYTGRSSAGQEKPRKIIAVSTSLSQDVHLKTVSNPWKPSREEGPAVEAENQSEVLETEALCKKFRSILNKLTPDNFKNLSAAVTDLNINSENKLGEVIDIVFAKALAEPGYCVLYGQMCSHLKKTTAGQANFGNTLLKKCQDQFNADIYSGINLQDKNEAIAKEEDPEVKKRLEEELYEEMFKCRMRGLGLIKFIGELYKIDMLNDQIMFGCVHRLLKDLSEESLECLCDLLTTIGEKLDASSKSTAEKAKRAQKGPLKANAYQSGHKSAAAVVAGQQKAEESPIYTLDPVFEELQRIRKKKDSPVSVRIGFKLLDLYELRDRHNWQSKKTKDNNPKKIDEIRVAHKEKLDQERRQLTLGPRRSQEGRRGLGHAGGSSSQISSYSNESNDRRGMHSSYSSQLIRDSTLGDNTKPNYNDVEHHSQSKLRSLEAIKHLRPPGTSSNDPLRPTFQVYTGGLRPSSKEGSST